MPRILVLGGWADSLINFRGEMLREMVSNGHEVFACAPNGSADLKNILSSMGVEYRDIMLYRTGVNPIKDMLFIKRMVSLFRSVKPDMFLGYTIKPVIYGSIAARIAGVHSINSIITGLGFSFSKSTIKGRLVGIITEHLYKLALRFNEHVFFQNPDDMELFKKNKLIVKHGQAILVNGSGVNVDVYHPESFPSSISFLLIARLMRDKGVYEYVEAARIIRTRYPFVKFRMAGWIDSNPHSIEEKELKAWQELGYIEFLGMLDDVRPAFKDSSVYVLPSYREGTPRTVLEAMAMGRPVITTDAPGCRETVKNNVNGYLVPIRDVNSLVQAMTSFIEQPDLIQKMGLASRDIAENKYDVRKVNAVILNSLNLAK